MKKLLNNLKASLLNILVFVGFKVKLDSTAIKRSMLKYFYSIDWKYTETITDVIVYKTKKELIVEVTTHRIGVFIGKRGNTIFGLEQWLKDDLLINNINVHVYESKLWYKLGDMY